MKENLAANESLKSCCFSPQRNLNVTICNLKALIKNIKCFNVECRASTKRS